MKALLIILVFIALNSGAGEGDTAPVIPLDAIILSAPCGPTTLLVNRLEQEYRERVVLKGLSKQGPMKFYANPTTATFTVAFETGGVTCIVMAGRYLSTENSGIPL